VKSAIEDTAWTNAVIGKTEMERTAVVLDMIEIVKTIAVTARKKAARETTEMERTEMEKNVIEKSVIVRTVIEDTARNKTAIDKTGEIVLRN